MVQFDQVVSRIGTNSKKWDAIQEMYHQKDLLPLWVADMDFMSPRAVADAFKTYCDECLFGYYMVPDSLYQAIADWEQKQHDVHVTKKDILFSSGVVPSIATAVQAFTKPGEAILINDPVYPPFSQIVLDNERVLVRSPLVQHEGHFVMDLVDMEDRIVSENVKLFILCNPHNPGGRVWSKEELTALAEICKKHGVYLVSDEIHQDLTFFGHTFTSLFSLDPSYENFTVVFTSATKTFNLAGIKNSMVLIKNPDLRNQFSQQQALNHQNDINTFGLIGTQVAYEYGKEWLTDLIPYLEENIHYVQQFFAQEMPRVHVMIPEGTYLMWLDFSQYADNDTVLQHSLVKKGKVLLNPGISFGPSGKGHMRLNIACPRDTLAEGLRRIKNAFEE